MHVQTGTAPKVLAWAQLTAAASDETFGKFATNAPQRKQDFSPKEKRSSECSGACRGPQRPRQGRFHKRMINMWRAIVKYRVDAATRSPPLPGLSQPMPLPHFPCCTISRQSYRYRRCV